MKSIRIIPLLLLCGILSMQAARAQSSKTIYLSAPETLADKLTSTEQKNITRLTLQGRINAEDVLFMSLDMKLTHVDLREVKIEATTVEGIKYPANTMVEDASFFGNKSLIEITLPQSLEKIGPSAFDACSRLQTIKIPATNLKHIGNSAFMKCVNLKDLYIDQATPPEVSPDTFKGFDRSACTLHVKSAAVSKYKSHPVWGGFSIVAQ